MHYFSFGLAMSAAKKAKIITAVSPPAAALIPPVKMPKIPIASTSFFTSMARRLPNPVNGTVAPAQHTADTYEKNQYSGRRQLCSVYENLSQYTDQSSYKKSFQIHHLQLPFPLSMTTPCATAGMVSPNTAESALSKAPVGMKSIRLISPLQSFG